MSKYLLKRITFAILALFILVTMVFFIMQVIPGFPIEKGAQETDAEFIRRLEGLGLTDPIIVQFGNYLRGVFTQFSFGSFFSNGADVTTTFFSRMSFTLPITFAAFFLGMFFGMVLGTVSAVFRGKWQDTTVNVFAVFFLSVPSFVVATFIIKIASEAGLSTTIPIPGSADYDAGRAFYVSLLAVLSLVFTLTPAITYYTRNELVEVLNQDYIKTALSKGLSYPTVIFKHGLRNALIPIIAISVPSFLAVFGGSLVIERFFGIPGGSTVLIDAIQRKEFLYVMFNVLFISFIYFGMQILADLSYTLVDPRIKLAQNNEMSLLKKALYSFKRNKHSKTFKEMVSKNTYFEVDSQSQLFKFIKENNLIQNGKIHFKEETVDHFDLNITKSVLVLEGEIYPVEYGNSKNTKTEITEKGA